MNEQEYSFEKPNIILAVSGGADSIAMLMLMLSMKISSKLIILHINHNTRGADSVEDAEFVRDIANSLELECIIENLNAEKNSEEYLRNNRYKIFEKYSKIFNADVFLGHNANDNTETILLNLFRGGSYRVLNGIPFKRTLGKNHIVRPLLCIRRDEIEHFLQINKVSFRNDISNMNSKYTRNFIRHETLNPLIQKFGKESVNRIFNMSKSSKYLTEFYEDAVSEYYSILPWEIFQISINKIEKNNIFIIGEILRKAMSKHGLKDFNYELVKRIAKRQSSAGTINKYLSFEYYGKYLYIYDKQSLQKIFIPQIDLSESEIQSENLKIKTSRYSSIINMKQFDGQFEALLSIPSNSVLTIRTFSKGEKFVNFNLHERSFTESLRANSIPLFLREYVPVLYVNNIPAWIIGGGINGNFKVIENHINPQISYVFHASGMITRILKLLFK